MHTRIPAIPTTYQGVTFRSRLEATWCAFFGTLGWAPAYEPVDLHGYIPDFLVQPMTGPLVVECKPMIDPRTHDASTARAVAERIARSGWTGDALMVGSLHHAEHVYTAPPPAPPSTDVMPPAPALPVLTGTRIRIGRVRWEGAPAWVDAFLAFEPDAARWYVSTHEDAATVLTMGARTYAEIAWSEAGNATRWNRPTP